MLSSFVTAAALVFALSFASIHETIEVENAIIQHNTPSANPLRITVEKVSGQYAKGTVSLADGTGETEQVYLKKQGNRWVVLDQGTGVNTYEIGVPDQW